MVLYRHSWDAMEPSGHTEPKPILKTRRRLTVASRSAPLLRGVAAASRFPVRFDCAVYKKIRKALLKTPPKRVLTP